MEKIIDLVQQNKITLNGKCLTKLTKLVEPPLETLKISKTIEKEKKIKPNQKLKKLNPKMISQKKNFCDEGNNFSHTPPPHIHFNFLASSSSSSSSRHSTILNHSDSSSGQIIELKTTPRTNAKEPTLHSEQKSPRKAKKIIKSKSLESKAPSFSLFADSFVQAESFLYRPNKFCNI